jgi:hypothetical protein
MSVRNLNSATKKALVRGNDARAYKYKGAGGRKSTREAKRVAAKAARAARKAEAAWLAGE